MPKSTEPNKLAPAPHQRSGVLSPGELAARGAVPTKERLAAGPVVMVECIENIPCNPCAYACPRKAITIEGELTDIPKVITAGAASGAMPSWKTRPEISRLGKDGRDLR